MKGPQLKGSEADSLMSEVGKVQLPSEQPDRLNHKNGFEIAKMYEKSSFHCEFAKQYAHSYVVRLACMRPILEKKIKEEWGSQNVSFKKIADLCESNKVQDSLASPVKSKPSTEKGSPVKDNKRNSHERRVAFMEDTNVAIIGTIFKHQPEKPSILQELNEDNPMVPVVPREKYISDKDFVLIEDDTTRVRLVATPGCGLDLQEVVNGIVCALKGKPTVDGKFEVYDVIWSTPKPAPDLKMKLPVNVETVFVSGLLLGNPQVKHSVLVELLFQHLQGLVGSIQEQNSELVHRTRVIFLGNLLWKKSKLAMESLNEELIGNAKLLDTYLEDLAKTAEVFVLPGKSDPGEIMMPQPPIHKCILPKSSRRTTFQSLSNPTRLSLGFEKGGTIDIICNSGENVTDALRNSSLECPVEMSRRILQWGHICPTAPDTLPLYPGCSDDAFIIQNNLPHVFIVGNQSKFKYLEWNMTKIVSVPDFSKTGSAVVMTKDLEFVELDVQAVF